MFFARCRCWLLLPGRARTHPSERVKEGLQYGFESTGEQTMDTIRSFISRDWSVCGLNVSGRIMTHNPMPPCNVLSLKSTKHFNNEKNNEQEDTRSKKMLFLVQVIVMNSYIRTEFIMIYFVFTMLSSSTAHKHNTLSQLLQQHRPLLITYHIIIVRI